MKKVVLRFGDYNTSTELYSVTAELWEDNNRTIQLFGKLPSADRIVTCYRNWQALYLALLQILEKRSYTDVRPDADPDEKHPGEHESRNEIEIEPGITNVSEQDFYDLCNDLKETIDDWLSYKEFNRVFQEIRADLNRQEEILVAIETDDEILWRLPWRLWSFFETYENSEVVLSNLQFIRPEIQKQSLSYSVRILAILGDSTGINLSEDRGFLNRLRHRNAAPKFLNQPQQQHIIEQLWQSPGCQILFFAGHSKSQANSTIGTIYINEDRQNNSVAINQIAKGIKQSVKNGLQLGIFNSCDGIGLARQLLDLKVPRVIVMREDVPNQVAQEFLKYFLQEFSLGKSLPIALRRARERLESIENRFPCASWLPVLCKNSATPALTWKNMKKEKPPIFWIATATAAIAIGAIFVVTPKESITQSPTNSICNQTLNANFLISCGEKIILSPKDRPPQQKKVDGVNAIANGNYSLAVILLERAWQADKDPETLIYLNNAKIHNEKNIYTIAVVVPFTNAPDFISQSILQGVAEVQTRVNQNPNQWKLRVAIADDYNNFGKAQQIARELGKRPDVLGVIGHYSSHVTTNVKHIYQQNKLVLISPTATAEELTVSAKDNKDNFFFRSTSTNKTGAINLANYLIAKNYKKVIIFYTQGKAFSESFKKEFKKNINNKITIVGDFNLEESEAKIREKVAKLKKQYPDAAIALFPDAFNTTQQTNNKLAVIQANNGELLIVGNNTVYDAQILGQGKQVIQNIVVNVPWSPSKNQTQNFQKFWGNNKQPIWYYGMSVDATEIFVTVLTALDKNQPSRTKIQEILTNDFQSEGYTGKITLEGSNRQEQLNTLVKPICQSDISCYWQKIQ